MRVGTGFAGGSIPSIIRWNCLYVSGGLPAFISMILQQKYKYRGFPQLTLKYDGLGNLTWFFQHCIDEDAAVVAMLTIVKAMMVVMVFSVCCDSLTFPGCRECDCARG